MVRILSHRGYRKDNLHENTIQAFEKALDLGADGFEFDIHLSKDKEAICYHDNTLDNIGVSKSIKELTKKEIISIGSKKGIEIPTLDEILQKFGNKTFLNIEIKAANAGSTVYNILKEYNTSTSKKNLVISSFLEQPLKELRQLNPKIPIGLLFLFPWFKIGKALKLDCSAIHPYYDKPPYFWQKPLVKTLSRRAINLGLRKKLMVNCWTVNDPDYIKELLDKNIEGIVTDNLVEALQIRGESNYN